MASIVSNGDVAERKVGFLLGLGIFFLPYIFVWLLLRKGHTTGARVIGFGWLAVCVLAFMGSNHAGKNGSTSSPRSVSTATTATSTAPTPAAHDTEAASAPSTPSKWTYQDTSDTMRGTKGRIASVDADDELDFDFPYNGGSTASLNLRHDERGLNVYLSVTKGQFICNNFSDTTVTVRFDNGPIRHFGCTDTSDGSANTVFLTSENKFVSELKQATHVTIEATFFQAGNRQMSFDTAGLDWR